MLGSTFFFREIDAVLLGMPSAIVLSLLRRFVFPLFPAVIFLAVPRVVWAQSGGAAAAQSQSESAVKDQGTPAKGAKAVARAKAPAARSAEQEATLEAKQQRQVGRIYYADGDVDVRYQNTRLRADHVEYNEDTQVVTARGHVQLDYETQHVEAEDARYEVNTGRGTFHHVRATFAIQRHTTPTLLISPNPIYFEAEEAERLDPTTYRVHKAWMTVCKPDRPTWKFYAPEATVYMKTSVHLENGNFRLLFRAGAVPAVCDVPRRKTAFFRAFDSGHRRKLQQGIYFRRRSVLGANRLVGRTLGVNYYSRRGWAQRGDLRMRPWENARLDVTYNGVVDRGMRESTGELINQGGHEERLLFTALLPDGWRAVADLDNLSSLTYRLAFSETYTQAVNSEVRNQAFLTNNFQGFGLNMAALSYQNYLSATTVTTPVNEYVSLRTAPEVRFSSVDQAPWEKLPFYFSFDMFSDAAHRSNNVTNFETPNLVERSAIAPSITMPFHWGPWLGVTPTFTMRSTYYGGQVRTGRS